MILIGQYDSPFVRRVAIAMRRYGLIYEHQPWATFADVDRIAEYNPLRRVPTLILDSGEVLLDSGAILDYLDELVGEERALLPRSGQLRRDGLRIIAFATGLADKSVSLYLEFALRSAPSKLWINRCLTQMSEVLDWFEADRAKRQTTWWLGEALTHADIAVACALCHIREAHPDVFDAKRWPRISAHLRQADDLEEFKVIYQPFVVTLNR
jgi:glutathione S-transferase